jgi:hypothetical protein
MRRIGLTSIIVVTFLILGLLIGASTAKAQCDQIKDTYLPLDYCDPPSYDQWCSYSLKVCQFCWCSMDECWFSGYASQCEWLVFYGLFSGCQGTGGCL